MAGACCHLSSLLLLQALRSTVALTPKRYRVAGDGSIRSPVFYLTAHDGNAHTRHARRRDQGRARVERHDSRPAFHDRLLESHLCLAQGTLVLIHVTANRR